MGGGGGGGKGGLTKNPKINERDRGGGTIIWNWRVRYYLVTVSNKKHDIKKTIKQSVV